MATTLQLREPSHSQLPQVAALLRHAFWDDAIFGDLMHPHRAQYLHDYERWFLQRLRASFWNARSWMLIAFCFVREGLQQAEEDAIYASVTSAQGKDTFYRNCGFEVQDGCVGMGGEGRFIC